MTIPPVPRRYEIRSLLGEGGSGRVYRVQDSIRDRELALKLVTPAESAFLRREFDTLRQIRHENLIQVFDWGTLPSGEAYYTMELIEGGDWSRHAGAPQPEEEVRRILAGILRGLAHLHCHGQVHRDLKPSNILLGAGGVVKISDVGMGSWGVREQAVSGTPGYVAPEVLEGSPAHARSDLYSVGVMAYEALTGRYPFAGRTVREVLSGQLEGWVASPRAHDATIAPDLERAVMRALERQPGLRHGSADEFMEDFGVEERIGTILGGRLVGREKEISEIEKHLHSEEPGTPTLLFVTGEPGIGKTALIEEVLYRASVSGIATLKSDTAVESPLHLFHGHVPVDSTAQRPADLIALADALGARAEKSRLLICLSAAGPAPNGGKTWLTDLSRLVWAISLERSAPSRTLFLVAGNGARHSSEAFETSVRLAPLTSTDVNGLFQSALGHVQLEHELIAKIHSLSGGNPGAVRSCLTSLIDQGLIQRRAGRWVFRERQQIQTIQLPIGVNSWALAWGRLDPREREILALLSLANQLTLRDLAASLGERAGSLELVAGLDAKGWVSSRGAKVSLASDAIRRVVLVQTGFEERQVLARALLDAPGTSLEREERADLGLEYVKTSAVLADGMWAADQATKRGEQRLVERRLRACLHVASQAGDHHNGRRIALSLAEALHELGEDSSALECLDTPFPWSGAPPDKDSSARRIKMLGTIEAAQGNLTTARKHFDAATRAAEAAGNPTLVLQCHAALAELDWRHGNDSSRQGVIQRVPTILASAVGREGGPDERANLTYQLGAALIRSGSSPAAEKVLLPALELECSDYWRMRITNALSSASFYQGHFEDSVKWNKEAWKYAERAGANSFKSRILFNRAGLFYGFGRHRDSVEQHRVAATWARRVGSKYDYMSACEGLSINLTMLALYEAAIDEAQKAGEGAGQLGDAGEQAKAFELEGLANYFIGDYARAGELVAKGQKLLQGFGYVSVQQRLDWLQARLLLKAADWEGAETILRSAERVLLETRDWEDLPCVQIDLRFLECRRDPTKGLEEIARLTTKAQADGGVVVQLHGAGVLAQVMLDRGVDDAASNAVLETALAQAEESGAAEAAWWLAYCLGAIAARRGDPQETQTRFRRAVLILNQIADGLTEGHRAIYLRRPHTAAALRHISELQGSLAR